MSGLTELLASIKWVPHIYKDGARYHVFSHGLYSDGRGLDIAVTWCSEPNCEHNRREALALETAGVDPLLFSDFRPKALIARTPATGGKP